MNEIIGYCIGMFIGAFFASAVFILSFDDCEIVERKELIKIGYARYTTVGAFEITDIKLKGVVLK